MRAARADRCHALQVAADLETWLRATCEGYSYDLAGVYRRAGRHDWPLTAETDDVLEQQLAEGGHLLPLPKEPAALANVLEVSVVDFILQRLADVDGGDGRRGGERTYPDIEISGAAFDGGFHAVDIKIARRGVGKRGVSANTQSRVTLYTGNTYFRYPSLHWPGTFRPFEDYTSHLDIVGVYTLNADTAGRVEDLDLIVQPPWKIASRQRSSTTREYIGGVVNIEDLRAGRGEFDSADEFYRYWRKYKFKIGDVVQKQLDRLIAEQRLTRIVEAPLPDPPEE